MAKVFENSMVAHVWAQRTQDEGRSNNGNFYFVGPVLYSYGSHFVVGVIDERGRAWLNTDGYSSTTAKHKSYAWRAVSRAFRVPSLTGIYRAIQALDTPSRRAWVKRELRSYFASHWRDFPADSEAAAILWAAVSRTSWAAARARYDAKAARDAARVKAANDKAARADASRMAKEPLRMIRARFMQIAASVNEYSLPNRLAEETADIARAHKAARTPRIKAAMWERLKLARELKARLVDNPIKRRDAMQAVQLLRRLRAGDYSGQGALNIAIAERDALRTLISHAPGSAAFHGGWNRRIAELAEEIARLERERHAARMAEQAERRAAWLANDPDAPRYAYDLQDERGGALLRATGVGLHGCTVVTGELETSQGATVPLAHAVRAFGFIRALRERGEGWSRGEGRSIRVGHFTIDRIEPTGDFVAGCHHINWGEVERLAREIGVWDCPATELESQPEGEAA